MRVAADARPRADQVGSPVALARSALTYTGAATNGPAGELPLSPASRARGTGPVRRRVHRRRRGTSIAWPQREDARRRSWNSRANSASHSRRAARQHRVEHRLQRRAASWLMTLQHVARSRSAAPATRSARGARLHLVEQPHVLDRDHGLVGEGGDQLDLLVGERRARP